MVAQGKELARFFSDPIPIEDDMAYLIVRTKITDEQQFSHYRAAVLPLIESFGGKHVRRGTVERLEGEQDGYRMSIFEFPTLKAIKTFWDSPEYIPVKQLRQDAAVMDVWAVP